MNAEIEKVLSGESEGCILCGDSLEIMADMPDGCVDLAWTDPPYNVGKEYDIHDDKMQPNDYFGWCDTWIWQLRRVSISRAIYPPKIHLRWFWERFQEAHLVIAGWSPEGVKRNSYVHQYIPLLCPPKPLQYTKDLWWNVQVPGLGYFYREPKLDHPCRTSDDITERIINSFSDVGDVIFDPFNGVGTTCVAAKKLGRRWIGIDISEKYCQIARNRLQGTERPLFPQ